MDFPLTTGRLQVRPWTVDDADAALATYGTVDVTGWLTPAIDNVADRAAMRAVLNAWVEVQPNLQPPRGRWAIETTRRLGMKWVGETDKYYGRVLQVYRIRPSDLVEVPAHEEPDSELGEI